MLPLNKEKLHTYRFFEGKSDLCSKSLGYLIGKDKFALLFLRENRPDKDTLAFQIINTKTFEPESIVETDYAADDTEKTADGFIFKTHEKREGLEMGKTKIKDADYVFQDRNFPIWMKYSLNGFEISGSVSFQKNHWKDYFKNENDFFETSGWDKKEKKFKNSVLYVAVNHKLKKECILLTPAKVKITGEEPGWRCN